MSTIERLSPQDFRREFDPDLFFRWKNAYNRAYIHGMVNFAVVMAAPLIIYPLALLGLILWFIISITCIVLMVRKNKKVDVLNAELGINKQDIVEAIRRCKKRA